MKVKQPAFSVKFIDHKDPLLKEVCSLGKKHANSLGLFPEGAFQDHARKKCIITASENKRLLGYLLFRTSYTLNRVNITHLCVCKEERGKGIAKALLDELVNKFQHTHKGIGLSCRNDYEEASTLWKKFGFKPVSERRSRSVEENYLTYWWYDFGNHDLFSLNDSDSKVKAIIDANIIIQLRDAATEQVKESEVLLSDWLLDDVEYLYASEIFNEIQRDGDSKRREQTRKFLGNFNQIRCTQNNIDTVFNQLSSILSGNNENDISDRKQLSEAIASGLEYFITRDKKMLESSELILQKFGIAVVRPNEFIIELDKVYNKSAYQPVRLAGVNFDYNKVTSAEIKEIIEQFHCAGEKEPKKDLEEEVIALTSDVKNADVKVLKNQVGDLVAVIGQKKCNDSICEIPLFRIKKSSLSNTLFKQLILSKIIESINKKQAVLKITEKYLSPDHEQILSAFNFFKREKEWYKISLKGISASNNLKESFPLLSHFNEYEILAEAVNIANEISNNADLKLRAERSLFPLKFSDIDIPTFVIPIKPIWAGHLFDSVTASQTIQGAKPELAWNRENVYYRSKNQNVFSFPARILWYSSDEQGYSRSKQLVACSYLDEVEIDTVKSLYQKYKRFGIYEWKDVLKVGKNNHENEIMAIRFSDTELFPKSIPFEKLNKFLFEKTGKKYTFQSPVKITNDLFLELYKIGMNL